jgi:hypothetical protein
MENIQGALGVQEAQASCSSERNKTDDPKIFDVA